MSDKPREVFIGWTDGETPEVVDAPVDGAKTFIEKSAYDALKAENKVLSERFVSITEYGDLEAENERLAERYRNIELANKEMSRNDHVLFGHLLQKRDRALAMLEKMAGALDMLHKDCFDSLESRENALEILAEYRRAFKPDPKGEPKITEGVPELFK